MTALTLHSWTQYYNLTKPKVVYLIVFTAMVGMLLAAEGLPDMGILLVFIAGVFVMRSAGCVINDYADRKIDPHVERTRDRPLAGW